MRLSDMTTPTPEKIMEVKMSYNRLLKRLQEAGKYLDDINISVEEREKHILTFEIEVLTPLESYLQVLHKWNVFVTDDEIVGGIKTE